MTRLYVVRHAEPYWEAEQRLKGQLDLPLTARGRRQAADLAEYFRGAPVAAVYCSTLSRARDTARPIAEAAGCALLASPLLNERQWGRWQGLTTDEIARERAAGRGGPSHSAPLGEPWPSLAWRAQVFLGLIAHGRPGQTVVTVTHGGIVKDMVLPALGVPAANRSAFTAGLGSITLLEHTGGAWRGVFLNVEPAWAAEHHPAVAAPAGS